MKTSQAPQKNSAADGAQLLRRESLVEQFANLLTESLRRDGGRPCYGQVPACQAQRNRNADGFQLERYAGALCG